MCITLCSVYHVLIGPRPQLCDAVDGMILGTFEHLGKRGFGVHLVHLGGLNERICHRYVFAACF